MVLRQPGGTRVEVEMVVAIPRRALGRVGLGDGIATADCPDAPARAIARLQDRALVAGATQFVAGGHAGDAGPDDDDTHAAPGGGRQRGRASIGLRHPH